MWAVVVKTRALYTQLRHEAIAYRSVISGDATYRDRDKTTTWRLLRRDLLYEDHVMDVGNVCAREACARTIVPHKHRRAA